MFFSFAAALATAAALTTAAAALDSSFTFLKRTLSLSNPTDLNFTRSNKSLFSSKLETSQSSSYNYELA